MLPTHSHSHSHSTTTHAPSTPKLNMLFSLLFNTLAIPISAGAIYPATGSRLPPEVAALAMALSSVSVVTSSLLLNLYRPPVMPLEGEETRDSEEGGGVVELAALNNNKGTEAVI